MTLPRPEPFMLDGEEHPVGPDCDSCWSGYPEPHKDCEHSPAGYMHASFGDENSDGDYWLYHRCDACGESS